MKNTLDPSISIRRVRSDEGPGLRELRLEALADPVASIAFLETLEEALVRPPVNRTTSNGSRPSTRPPWSASTSPPASAVAARSTG